MVKAQPLNTRMQTTVNSCLHILLVAAFNYFCIKLIEPVAHPPLHFHILPRKDTQ